MRSFRIGHIGIFVAASLTLAGCQKAEEAKAPAPAATALATNAVQPPVIAEATPPTPTPTPSSTAKVPKASKKAEPVYLEGTGADSVMPQMEEVRSDPIPNQTGPAKVRLYGGTTGDPAMNGLLTYIRFKTDYDSMNFYVGDILDYKILATRPGEVDVEISESDMAEDGTISTKKRRVTLLWSIPEIAETPVNLEIRPLN